MAKKLVKKRKLRIFRLFLVLLLLALFAGTVYLLLNDSIKNIVIKGNNYLKDDYIISLAEISDYPRFWFTSSNKMKKRIEDDAYIKKVKIKKRFYNKIIIEVEENTPLFIYETDQTIVFENGEKISVNEEIEMLRIPRVMNYVPDTKYETLIKKIKTIDKNVYGKISEITYTPNEYDPDRFLLYMDDSNSVYLTLTKFKMLNYYNKVLTQLEGRKGILYLDSGNHFQIKE